MIEEFQNFLSTENLVSSGEKVLLGVSGGIDSVVMTELFDLAGIKYGIAHCNFKLRGAESDLDEEFVSQLALQKNVDFFVKEFDTGQYAKENGISIQMAARDLRYHWFDELLDESDFQYIATAHHIDDQIETLFINLARGTGIAGLHGILPRQNKVIRPLMFAYRSDIESFAKVKQLKWREDQSNLSTNYIRNKIRHNLLPIFEEINPDFRRSIHETIMRLRETERVFNDAVSEKRDEIIFAKEDKIYLPIIKLLELSPLPTYLFELLSPFDFNSDSVKDILAALKGEPGKQFVSSSHILIKDREYLVIMKKDGFQEELNSELSIMDCTYKIKFPLKLKFNKFSRTNDLCIPANPLEAYIDFDLLKFPLTIRKWKQGDYFYPLGMKGRKKLSDYFIDQKFSLFDKDKTWLLCSGDDIIWIIGHRIDHRYRIQDQTKVVYVIEQID